MIQLKVTLSVLIISVGSIVYPLTASAIQREGMTQVERMEMRRSAEPEIVQWVGVVGDDVSSHDSRGNHELKFVKNENGETYDIEDSPELIKLHDETGKKYLVEIVAEKTPKFLFWGGNLIVKKFKVLGDVNETGSPGISAQSKWSAISEGVSAEGAGS